MICLRSSLYRVIAALAEKGSALSSRQSRWTNIRVWNTAPQAQCLRDLKEQREKDPLKVTAVCGADMLSFHQVKCSFHTTLLLNPLQMSFLTWSHSVPPADRPSAVWGSDWTGPWVWQSPELTCFYHSGWFCSASGTHPSLPEAPRFSAQSKKSSAYRILYLFCYSEKHIYFFVSSEYFRPFTLKKTTTEMECVW